MTTANAALASYRVEVTPGDLPSALVEAVNSTPLRASSTEDLTESIRTFAQGYVSAYFDSVVAVNVTMELDEDGNGTGTTSADNTNVSFTVTKVTDDEAETGDQE